MGLLEGFFIGGDVGLTEGLTLGWAIVWIRIYRRLIIQKYSSNGSNSYQDKIRKLQTAKY